MRVKIVFATFLLAMIAASTLEVAATPTYIVLASSEWMTLSNARLGCRTSDLVIELHKAEIGGDREAADKAIIGKLRTGECRLLPSGKVKIEATSPPMSCVRPLNIGECWWVPDEFLD
jgi:hypothetical protein